MVDGNVITYKVGISRHRHSRMHINTRTTSVAISRAFSDVLGGCPFHGRVERDKIPTRESPPKQSGTR